MAGTIGKLNVTLSMDPSNLEKGVKSANSSLGTLGSKLSTIGQFAVGNILGNIGYKLIADVGSLVTAGIDFGREMANVNSILQISTDQINAVGDSIIKLSEDSRITDGPTKLAAAYYDIVSAGYDVADAQTVLTNASMAASAGLTTTETSAGALVAILQSYNLSADQTGKISNQLFQIVNAGVITFDQLASVIGNVIPQAAALGVSLDDVGSAFVALTLKGVGPEEAATQINAVITGLLKPTDDLTNLLHDAGYASGFALIQAKGFGGALQFLQGHISGNADEAAKLFGDVRALRGILGLTANDGKDYADAQDGMSHAQDGAGATAKALAKQMESADYWIKQDRKDLEIWATIMVQKVSPAIVLAGKGISMLIVHGLIPLTNLLSKGVGKGLSLLGRGIMAIIGGPLGRLGAALHQAKAAFDFFIQFPNKDIFQVLSLAFDAFINSLMSGIRPLDFLLGLFRQVGHFALDLAHFLSLVAKGGAVSTDQFTNLAKPLRAVLLVGGQVVAMVERFISTWQKAGALAAFDSIPKGLRAIGRALDILMSSIGLNRFGDALKNDFYDMGQIITDGVQLVRDLINGDWSAALSDLGAIAVDAFNLMVDSVKTRIALGIDIGTILIKGVQWGWSELPDLWSWITTHAFDVGQGDGTGSNTAAGFGAVSGDSITIPQVLVKIASWAWGEDVRLWDWIEGQFSTTNNAGAAGAATGLGMPAPGTGLTLADVVVNIANWAPGAISDLGSWLITQLQGYTADLTSIIVNIANWVQGENWIDLGTWLYGILHDTTVYLVTVAIDIADWTVGANAWPSLGSWIGEQASSVGTFASDIWGSISATLAGADWGTIITADSFNFGVAVGTAIHGAIVASISLLTPTGMSDAWDAIWGVLEAALPLAEKSLLGAGVAVLSGLSGAIISAVAGPDAAADFSSFATDFADGIAQALKDGDWASGAAAMGQGLWDAVKTWVVANMHISDIVGWIEGGVTGGPASGTNNAPPPPSIGPVNPAGNSTDTGNARNALPYNIQLSFLLGGKTYSDLGSAIVGSIGTGPNDGAVATAKILADNTDVVAKFDNAMVRGNVWQAASFTGTFLGDDGDVAIKYTDVMTWGGIFGDSTFTGVFDGDNGPAAIAYTDAYSWGTVWADTTFTAKFDVDTSGLVNAVAIANWAAASIAAVMPHSPAKEGPLKEPITFDYIADNMAKTADRLKTLAAAGAGHIAGMARSGYMAPLAEAGYATDGGDRSIQIYGNQYITPPTADVHSAINAQYKRDARRTASR